jgi:hypothetical protein
MVGSPSPAAPVGKGMDEALAGPAEPDIWAYCDNCEHWFRLDSRKLIYVYHHCGTCQGPVAAIIDSREPAANPLWVRFQHRWA